MVHPGGAFLVQEAQVGVGLEGVGATAHVQDALLVAFLFSTLPVQGSSREGGHAGGPGRPGSTPTAEVALAVKGFDGS